MAHSDPIYVPTYYMQRKDILARPPASGKVKAPPLNETEKGYKLLPGRVVDIWFYNTAADMFRPAGTFFEPAEFADQRVMSFTVDAGGDFDFTSVTNPSDPNYDNFRLKFTDESYVPFITTDPDKDRGLVTAMIDQGTAGQKAVDLALASG